MPRFFLMKSITAPLAALLLAAPLALADMEPPVVSGTPLRLVVGFHGSPPPDLAARAAAMGATIVEATPSLSFVVLELPWERYDAAMAALRVAPDVRYATPDGRVHALFTPSDPEWPRQWGPPAIRLPEAWEASLGSSSVRVAILDAGIDDAHPDLAGQPCVRGSDLTGGGWNNLHEHGTHVAGILAAIIDNGVGVAGTSRACLLDIRILDGTASGQWSHMAEGIVQAVDMGASIVTISAGGRDAPPVVRDAVRYAHDRGVLVVAAAGNGGCPVPTVATLGRVPPDEVLEPARYPEVIAVAALSKIAEGVVGWSSMSSCGPSVEIAAPGASILSTLPGGTYDVRSGTSMAAPFVAGTAALVKARYPDLSAEQVRCTLDLNAAPPGGLASDPFTGFGRMDAEAALRNPIREGPLFDLCQSHLGEA